jgi:excisionase family DNA binding protein
MNNELLTRIQATQDKYGLRLLRVGEVMEILGVSRPQVYRMMKDGRLPVTRIAGVGPGAKPMLRVRLGALIEWLKQREVQQKSGAEPAEKPTY